MADDRRNSLLSGRIGVPDGAYRLLNDPIERAVENIVRNELTITNIIQEEEGGGGTAVEVWGNFNGDGTKITGSTDFVLTASRTREGDYVVTSSKTAGTSGSHYLFGVLVSVSSRAGDGADGVSAIKAFSSFNLEDTDDTASECFYEGDGELILMGSTADSIYRHDTDNFGGGPTIVDAGAHALFASNLSGCISKDHDYVDLSGDSGSFNIRIIRLSDNTVFDITDGSGVPATDLLCCASRQNGATHEVWVHNGGAVVKYTPNLAAETLGAAAVTYTGSGAWFGTTGASNQCPFIWDSSGYLWTVTQTTLVQLSATTDSSAAHADPAGITDCRISRLVYDPIRDRILAILSDGSDRHLYEFSGWTDLNAVSGTWRLLRTFESSAGEADFLAFHYDPTTGIYFVSNYSSGYVERYIGEPLTFVDRVPVDNTVANIDIDYDNWSSLTCWYEGTKGYVTGTNSAEGKMIQIVYEGSPIVPGSGGSFVTNFLNIMYEKASATTAQVRIFDNISQLLRDGEFTVKFIYP